MWRIISSGQAFQKSCEPVVKFQVNSSRQHLADQTVRYTRPSACPAVFLPLLFANSALACTTRHAPQARSQHSSPLSSSSSSACAQVPFEPTSLL